MPPHLQTRPACRVTLAAVLALGPLAGSLASARAEVPLHERIDQLIAAGKPRFDSQAAPAASDAEFMRRIYLDLIGTVPTITEARAFLGDAARDKRERLIDRLLTRPEYA